MRWRDWWYIELNFVSRSEKQFYKTLKMFIYKYLVNFGNSYFHCKIINSKLEKKWFRINLINITANVYTHCFSTCNWRKSLSSNFYVYSTILLSYKNQISNGRVSFLTKIRSTKITVIFVFIFLCEALSLHAIFTLTKI